MDAIIKEVREAIDQSYQHDRDNREQAIEDLRFTAGFQWSDAARQERRGRPMITINRSGQFLRQVSNPIRQNMPTLKVEPDSDEQRAMSDVVNGLLRRIQYNSSAGHVYASAVEHMVACGIGWFRVTTDYLDDDTFDQEILIKRVFDPLSVYPDPAAREPDRSDMGWCVVSTVMPRETFKKRYPKAGLASVDPPSNGGGGSLITWNTSDYVRVAEFWKREERTKTLALLRDGQMVELTSMGQKQLAMLKEQGLIVNTRQAKDYEVKMHLVGGEDVLDDEYECPCSWIPLIPVIGAEIPLEDGVYRHGIIRFQREPQQLHNYFMSVAAETLGQQPKSPYLVTANMIKRFKGLWDNANRDATPYLPYDPDPQAPSAAPSRIEPPPIPSGLIQMAQMLSDDMKSTTGIYDAALGNRSNETSGVAIGARVQQGEQATFHFVDNLEHSLEHLGRILLDMIPDVYDTERTLKIRGEDDTEKSITINQTVMEFEGQPIKLNDLSETAFKSVRVVLGPSYASKRQEALQNLLQLVQAVPAIAQVGGDIIARNLDFDGADQLAERLKAVLPPQVLQIENPEAAQPPPDPMAEMQQQGAMQAMQMELEANAAKTEQEKAKAEQERYRVEQEAMKVDEGKVSIALKVKELSDREFTRQQPQQAAE